MAITASTSAINNLVLGGPGKTVFEDGKAMAGTASTWNQGDLLFLDTSAHVLKVVAATGDSATFVGVADNSVSGGKLIGPYTGLTPVDASSVSPGFVGPKYGVVASLYLKASDAFVMGGKVYLSNGSDSQTVSSVDPGDAGYIGIFVGPAAVASAASLQQGKILIVAKYPAAAL